MRTAVLALLATASLCPAVDDGFAWKQIDGVHDAIRPFPSSVDPETVYVATSSGLVATHDGGATFAPLPAAPALGEVTALLVTPIRPQRLYAGTAEHGVFLSEDGGASWKALGGTDKGLAHARIRCLAFAADDAAFTTIYASHSLAEPGLSVTIDGGRSWRAFAPDYGADDLIPLGRALFFAGRNASQGDGFYRFDPARGWYCVLTEPPRALVGSQAAAGRVWFGTQGAGLHVSDDFGITMRDSAPGLARDSAPVLKSGDIVSVAVGWASATEELVYAFDPAGEGVVRSRDGFATWEKLDDGFAASEWTREGACLAADAAGRALYACRNGELFRGAPAERGPLHGSPRAEPAAVVSGDGLRLSCRAEPGTAITVDASALGGAAAFALADAGGGVFTASLDKSAPKRNGQFALPVTASRDGEQISALALVTILPRIVDTMLWNGEDHDNGVNWNSGGVSVAKIAERPLSPPAHLRVSVNGAGRAAWGWNGWGGGSDCSHHKLLSFSIRSDQVGPPKLRLAVRDDGSGSGLQNAQNSNEVDLARYLPQVGTEYRFVAIPIADLVFGSSAAPTGLRELMFVSDGGETRAYDIDDITLLARPAPRLGGPEARLRDDGAVTLAVSAGSDFSPLRSVAARSNGEFVELFDDGKHDDGVANDGRWAATVPIDRIGRGTRPIVFSAVDDQGRAELAHEVFIPGRAPAGVARLDAPDLVVDGKLDAFADVQPLVVGSGDFSAEARLLHSPKALYLSLTVTDPAFVAPDLPGQPKAEQLSAGPCVELLMGSPGEKRRKRGGEAAAIHGAIFAVGAKGAWAAAGGKSWPCVGAKTERGWTLEARLPMDALDGNWVVATGGSARLQLVLREKDRQASWSGGDGAVVDPERFGEVLFIDPPGAPRWRCVSAVGATLTLAANKPLERASAANAASWRAAGATITAAALDADRVTVRLTADKPWQLGQEVRVSFPGVRAEDGAAAAAGELVAKPAPGRPVDDGFVREFLIGEVKPNIDWTKVDQPLIDESIHPARESGWKYVATDGGVDLGTLIGGNNVGAHAHVYVWAESARAVQLWLGSDDGLRVAVNGQCVHRFSGARGVVADQDKVPNVQLKQGWNDLMLLITQGGGGWGFCLRIRDDQGKAPSGLWYAADSPFATPAAH